MLETFSRSWMANIQTLKRRITRALGVQQCGLKMNTCSWVAPVNLNSVIPDSCILLLVVTVSGIKTSNTNSPCHVFCDLNIQVIFNILHYFDSTHSIISH
ncbi:hypothetical protein ACFE04_028917 [Oxalis oulophora]